MLRFTLARPHLLIFVLVPLLFTNVVSVMFYVLRVGCCGLRLMCCGLRLMCYVLRVTLTLSRGVILVQEWWLLSIYLSVSGELGKSR